MRRLIDRPENVVTDSLAGLGLAHPDLLQIHYDPTFIMRKNAPTRGKVALISGSGSGHEPLNTGYVGVGMLDAACPGPIFTSATPDQLLAATRAVDGGAGVLYIVKNYTGGVLNAEMATELAPSEGFEVDTVLIHDEVAQDGTERRRGMGATVLVEKIAGAAAEAGRPLHLVAEIGRRVSAQSRSMGVGITPCVPPGVKGSVRMTEENLVQLGYGIHGEPGRYCMPDMETGQIMAILVDNLVRDLPFNAGDQVLVLMSGLGGTPLIELYIAYRHVHRLLSDRGVRVARSLVGNYITSLETAGCTVTLLRLDAEMLSLWDAPVHTSVLHW